MAQKRNLLNGFTGFSSRDSGFVSAGDAIRRAEGASRAADAAAAASAASAAAGGGASYGSHAAYGAYASQGSQGVSGMTAWGMGSAGANNRFGVRSAAQDIFDYACDKSLDDNLVPQFDPEKLARIPEEDRRWSWIEIDLNAIRHNVMALRARLAQGTRLMAVVKADAYGHGAVKVAKTALNSGADYLGVASVDEAMQLREAYVNAPILVLCEPPDEAIPLLLGYKIMPSVYTPAFAVKYAEAAEAFGLRAPYHLKVNTGMNRIGVPHSEVLAFLRQVGFHRALDLVGTYTHFATADGPETLDFYKQEKRFLDCLAQMYAAGVDPGIIHAANSSAAVRYPNVHFDMVRAGIALYGHHPCAETQGLIDLRPAMSVHARITDTHLVSMSEGVSYGMNYRSPGSVKICTVPVGYADGLRRGLSGRTDFIVDGQRFHQVGTICMDQCMFEVDLRSYGTHRRVEPQIGDEVVIVGRQGEAEVTIEQMCATLDTIPYELLIGFSHRMPKKYR